MIYCSGDLLAAVNIHSLYTDSKTFVDKPLKDDPGLLIVSQMWKVSVF